MKYYTIDENVINKLREELSIDENIIIAIIFGSAIRRKKVRDIDVAVFLRDFKLRKLLQISDRLSKAVGIDVDVVPLNDLREDVAYEILTNGKPILVRDEKLLANLKLRYWLLYLEMKELVSILNDG